ncbi:MULTISPECIES: aminotransferase-like domain-containing protein [Streptomyces]|uniref:aminotransferase-like domain-containing protein n=1 Tax=Streptomyces herbicida TaxID=3065675 RepID=UPI00292D42E0|nr:PLP-dependent aminotransferase family protein [Streptomyces sp. NEAU-HV9]
MHDALPNRTHTEAIEREPETVPPAPVAARLAAVPGSPLRDILALTDRPEVVSFAGGLPDPGLFDQAGLRAAFHEVLAHSALRVLQYSRTEGDPELRDALATRLSRRGLPTSADDVLITTGSQQALAVSATALLDPGDTVVVEDPSYLAALQCFRLAGARVVPLPPQGGGLNPELLLETVRRERPKVLYVVPNFQNPTGHTLSRAVRAQIARIAAVHGLWIVEDDPYGDLRYRGEPLPALAAHAGAEDRTLLLGSFSKTLAPGLRLGWIRMPQTVRRALVVAKQSADLHTSTLDQAAVARYLAQAPVDEHLARLREAYRTRLATMLEGLPDTLPHGSTWSVPDGGMFLWARLPDGWDTEASLPHALRRNVAYVPGAPFFAGTPVRASLRLSFTTHAPQDITAGLARLAAALKQQGKN